MRRAAAALLALLTMANDVHAQTLLLEIWINGRNTHVIARVVERDGEFEIARTDLAEAGLAVARTGVERVGAASAVRAVEDVVNQRLLLTVEAQNLSRTTLDLRPSIVEDVTPAGRGAMLRYNLSATANDIAHLRGSSAGAALALTIFQDSARFTTTGFAAAGLSSHGARLDTSLEFDTPSEPRRIIVGDAITGVPQWARSVRFGGIEIATDFSQQPDRITFPLPQFFGLAAVPSSVDVFVGASRVFSGAVDEGPFALNNLPVMTGGGSATVVMRDVLGRETSQAISLYTDPTLLAPGLSSYSLDAGFLRRDYGIANADYAMPFASLLWRAGLRDFTAQVHGQFAPSFMLASAGIASTIGDFGLLSADAAMSRHDGNKGMLASANFTARTGPFSLFGDIAATAGRFADLASLSGDVFPSLRYQTGISVALNRAGSLSLGWIGERMHGASATELASASYSLSFGNGLFFGLTGFRSFSDGSWAGQMFVSVPLGNGAITSVSATAGQNGNSAQAVYDSPADPDGGFGYRLLAGNDPVPHAEADASWVTDRGTLDGAVAPADGRTAARMDASGGLVLLDGQLYATRAPEGAVALVETGAPGVRIYRENRVVAHSDEGGNALLTDLNPYAANRIGVDPRDYPLDTDVAIGSRIVVPPRDAGVIVKLAPVIRHSFVAVIRFADGDFPPVGALVSVSGGSPPLIVGRGGEIFFGGIEQPADVTIETLEGRCHARIVPPPAAAGRISRAGPFICENDDVR